MQGAVRATIQQCRTFYKYAWFSTSVRSLFLCPPGGKYPNQARWLAHQGLQFLESGAEEYCIPHCDESWKSIVLELGQCEDTWPFAKPNQWFQLVSYVSIFLPYLHPRLPLRTRTPPFSWPNWLRRVTWSRGGSQGWAASTIEFNMIQQFHWCVCVQVFAFMFIFSSEWEDFVNSGHLLLGYLQSLRRSGEAINEKGVRGRSQNTWRNPSGLFWSGLNMP